MIKIGIDKNYIHVYIYIYRHIDIYMYKILSQLSATSCTINELRVSSQCGAWKAGVLLGVLETKYASQKVDSCISLLENSSHRNDWQFLRAQFPPQETRLDIPNIPNIPLDTCTLGERNHEQFRIAAGIANEISCRMVSLAYRKQKMLRKIHVHM